MGLQGVTAAPSLAPTLVGHFLSGCRRGKANVCVCLPSRGHFGVCDPQLTVTAGRVCSCVTLQRVAGYGREQRAIMNGCLSSFVYKVLSQPG